jgi:hypothetical protein
MHRIARAQPSLKDIETEAMHLLRDLRGRKAAALARYYSLDPLAGTFQPRLSDAQ